MPLSQGGARHEQHHEYETRLRVVSHYTSQYGCGTDRISATGADGLKNA